MNKEKIIKLAESLKNKPESYHYICYGGSTTKMIDKWSTENTFECRYQGEKTRICHACEKCEGLKSDKKELKDIEKAENRGIEKLLEALLAKLTEGE